MKYPHIKKLKLSHAFIAKAFRYKNVVSFRSSSAHKRIMQGIEEILRVQESQRQSEIMKQFSKEAENIAGEYGISPELMHKHCEPITFNLRKKSQ